MKYVVEFNGRSYSPQQIEVEAESVVDAIEAAWGKGEIFIEEIDDAKEPQYGAQEGGQRWKRVTINVLPGGFAEEGEDHA
jgi:hypothetical protein